MTTIHTAFDDVTLSLIPRDAEIVAAYVDGIYANFDAAVAEFGPDRVRGITVHGEHGDHIYWCDSERGDLTVAQAVAWVEYEVRTNHRTARGPYSAASDMQAIIDGLAHVGVQRFEYPYWSAHYGRGPHICSPSVCGYPQADGTQYTDVALGRSLDESEVTDRWLGKATSVKPGQYPGFPIRYGDRGQYVQEIQQRLHSAHNWPLVIDGVFGGHTLGAVQVFQRHHGLKDDGIVGPQTWGKLF